MRAHAWFLVVWCVLAPALAGSLAALAYAVALLFDGSDMPVITGTVPLLVALAAATGVAFALVPTLLTGAYIVARSRTRPVGPRLAFALALAAAIISPLFGFVVLEGQRNAMALGATAITLIFLVPAALIVAWAVVRFRAKLRVAGHIGAPRS